jgi:hypothetical protein
MGDANAPFVEVVVLGLSEQDVASMTFDIS